MMKFITRPCQLFLIILLTCSAFAVQAEVYDDIYTVCVSVDNPADNVETLVRKGFIGILIALAETPEVARDRVVEQALAQAPDFLQGYRYVNGCTAEDATRALELYFAAPPIDALLADAGFGAPVQENNPDDPFANLTLDQAQWGVEQHTTRPYTLVVEAIYTDDQYQKLTAQLQRLPDIDSVELQQVSTSEVVYHITTSLDNATLVENLVKNLPIIPLSSPLAVSELRVLYVS